MIKAYPPLAVNLSSTTISQDSHKQSLVGTEQITSPTSPEFSPITPKVDPIIPAQVASSASSHEANDSHAPTELQVEAPQAPQSAIAPTQYIQQPPPQPFSSAESSDGLALKAAISSLQYQRQKAQDDLRSLDQIRSLALADPESFARDLAAGRLKEKRHNFGSLDDVVDAQSAQASGADIAQAGAGGGSSQSRDIPGPQNVVRMPHINWDKYHVVGEALDSLHEQQRRWPGSPPFQQDRGREAAVLAPYSPFQDLVDGQTQHSRNSSDTSKKDSLTSTSVIATPTTLEHPYETRRTSSK